MIETVFANARFADGALYEIGVGGGRILSISPAGGPAQAGARVDLAGALVVAPFVEGHIHLDTSFYGDRWFPHRPCTDGFDVRERVAFQAENMARAAPMAERARNQLNLCLANGSLILRSHVMVDGSVGLKSLETILAVREAFRDLVDLQIVAFPQSGILRSPGAPELLDEAVRLGAEVVGGLDPLSLDRDAKAHLDVVFGVATKHGADVDIHLHDGGLLGAFTIEDICDRTVALGLQGHVAVSHAYALGDLAPEAAQRLAQRLARSGVAIMTNAPGARAFPPVALLRAEGVTVFSGSDNIRDSWWPYGDGDMLGRAMMIGYRSGFYEDRELAAAFDVVTAAGAKALRIESYGLAVGGRADFVALPAAHVPQAVVAVPRQGRKVFRGGRLVAQDGAMTSAVGLPV